MKEFDRFAQSYKEIHTSNVRISGEKTSYFAEYKVRTLAHFSARNYSSILDFGCGIGNLEQYLTRQYSNARISGVDCSKQSIDIAQQLNYNNCSFYHFDGYNLPFDSEHFDLAILANSLHHIDKSQRKSIINEIKRVLIKGGDVIIFEHNPLNPLTLHAVNTCDFDVGVKLLTSNESKELLLSNGFKLVSTNYIVFFPHFLSFFRRLEYKLGFCPFGAQYYILGRNTDAQ